MDRAAQSAGSALGGLGYGAVAWRVSADRRLAPLTAGLAGRLAAPGARTRAGNWVSAGSSAGPVLSGQVAGRIPLGACLPVLAVHAVPAVLAVVPRLRARQNPVAVTRPGD